MSIAALTFGGWINPLGKVLTDSGLFGLTVTHWLTGLGVKIAHASQKKPYIFNYGGGGP